MADIKWIKLCVDVFENRKIRQLESLPEADSIILLWFRLLCLAGSINDEGLIYLTENIPYTAQMLADYFHKSITTVQMALKVFSELQMIELEGDYIRISNWEKYQNIEQLAHIKAENARRNREYRARKKAMLEAPDKVISREISRDAIEQEQDKNKNKKKNNIVCLSKNQNFSIRDLITDTEYDALDAEVADIEALLYYVDGYIKEPPQHPYQYLLAVAKRQKFLKEDI